MVKLSYLEESFIYVKEKSDDLIKAVMEGWYREKTQEHVKKRIKYFLKFFSKAPTAIKVKEQKKRWDSPLKMGCSLTGDDSWLSLQL